MGSNRITLLSTLVAVFTTTSLLGQGISPEISNPDLKTVIEAFDAEISELKAPLHALDAQYEALLNKLKIQKELEGDLDRMVVVENEIKTFKSEPHSEITTEFPELKTMRRIYLNEKRLRSRQLEGAVTKTTDRHTSKLKSFVVHLTKNGRISDALEAKAYLESLNPPPEPETLEIELFWLPNFEGESVKLTVPANVPRFAQHPKLRNDSLRSIRIPDKVTVNLGTGADLTGETIRLRKDTAEISIKGVSSLEAK